MCVYGCSCQWCSTRAPQSHAADALSAAAVDGAVAVIEPSDPTSTAAEESAPRAIEFSFGGDIGSEPRSAATALVLWYLFRFSIDCVRMCEISYAYDLYEAIFMTATESGKYFYGMCPRE